MSTVACGIDLRRHHLVVRPVWWGVLGATSLAVVYTAFLTLLSSLQHAWEQYLLLWPWMTPLVAGFGLQIALFGYMVGYRRLAEAKAAGTAAVAATAGISSAAMIACCLHHVTDILPVLGFSAAATFLGAYQSFFLAISAAAVRRCRRSLPKCCPRGGSSCRSRSVTRCSDWCAVVRSHRPSSSGCTPSVAGFRIGPERYSPKAPPSQSDSRPRPPRCCSICCGRWGSRIVPRSTRVARSRGPGRDASRVPVGGRWVRAPAANCSMASMRCHSMRRRSGW